jgi:hypothetical protein
VPAPAHDLPDPLDPTPAMAVSDPDDLLSKMADEAIDRLMADADRGHVATAPPVPMASVASDAPDSAARTGTTPEAGAADPSADSPVPPPDPAPGASASVPAPAAPPNAAETLPGDVAVSAPSVDHGPAVDPPPPPAAADRQALLGDAPAATADHGRDGARTPWVLWPLVLPLRLLNAPFGWLGDNARRVLGLLGLVTLVPSACVLIYLLWLKKH